MVVMGSSLFYVDKAVDYGDNDANWKESNKEEEVSKAKGKSEVHKN